MSTLAVGMTVQSPGDGLVVVRELRKRGAPAAVGIEGGTTFLIVAVLAAAPAEKIDQGDLMAVVPGRLAFYLLKKDVAESWRSRAPIGDWPRTMKKTRKEMRELDLPGGDLEVSDSIVDQRRWATVHELVFRLDGMPEDLAYRTYYDVGSTEMQDQRPWEYEDAECTLVRLVEKVVKAWEEA